MNTKALSCMLVASCLFLAGAVSSRAQKPASSAKKPVLLDYRFFKDKVEPVFLNKRPGHARCVVCHTANHVAFHLVPLPPGGTTWNEAQSRRNFELIQKAVDFDSLEKSPLLRHPLAQQAGGDPAHGGGKHFESQDNPEWLILKAWVFGAKEK